MASIISYCLPRLLILLFIAQPSSQQQQQQQQEVDYTPKLNPIDLNTLLSIKNTLTDLPTSSFFLSWDSSSLHPCSSFAGVTCSLVGTTLRVTALSLGSPLTSGLAGSLPNSLSQLTELTQLILNPGLVTGPIPPQLGLLLNLRVLSLPRNRLTGPIPSSLSSLTRLHTLDLGFNRLSGSIPPPLFTHLTHLRVLILASNYLTGPIPKPGSQLFHLDLKMNRLVGPLPPNLPLSLRYLSLSANHFWGPINGLESLSELVYLDLSVNQFGGSLPSSLLRPSLSSLFLQWNNFSGALDMNKVMIPYPEGSVIDLSHNRFSGEPPEAVAGAETIYLNNNQFSGAVPESYGSGLVDGRIKTLYLQHNFIDTFPKKFVDKRMLPDDVEVCLAYNCMVPPVGLVACPANAGDLLSRPAGQCYVFHNN